MGYIGRSPAVNEFAACIGHGQFCSRKLLAGRDILLGDIGLVLIRCVIHGNSAAFDNTLHHFKGNALCLIISTGAVISVRVYVPSGSSPICSGVVLDVQLFTASPFALVRISLLQEAHPRR